MDRLEIKGWIMDTIRVEQQMKDTVLRFFQEEQWNYQIAGPDQVIRAGYRGDHGTWVCYARVDEDQHLFTFHAVTGMDIPVQYRAQVLEYLMRVNSILRVGSLELNFDKGDVRYKACVETPENELSIAMVRAIAYHAVHTIDHYFPGVMAVIHGGLSPEAALARSEVQAAAD